MTGTSVLNPHLPGFERFASANCPPVAQSQTGSHAGRTEMRVITQSNLKEALSQDQTATENKKGHSDAARGGSRSRRDPPPEG